MSRSTRYLALLAVIGAGACSSDIPNAPDGRNEARLPPHANAHAASESRAAARPADFNRQLAELRRVTARFHNIEMALAAGYDVEVTSCWEHRALGAMGYHYGNPRLINDSTIALLEPELLMYEPGPSGHMQLVGMEYIVPIDDWQGDSAPTLLGQTFHPHSELPIYKLHIWLWRDNPRGIFEDWNPKVSCKHASQKDFFE
jgi:hypothetical protein